MTQGSVAEFAANWQRPEAQYCHFTRDEPVNQIQFAFRQNWLEFARIMEPMKPWAGLKSLEVGAGRGTMSMYFADAGFDCTLLDSCGDVLKYGRANFHSYEMAARFDEGDAKQMPYGDGKFDVVFSYGLMEHFDDIRQPLLEQARVLRRGGLLLSYVVPCNPNSSYDFRWVKYFQAMNGKSNDQLKEPVYRNGQDASYYENVYYEICGEEENKVFSEYVYNSPMIGASQFPFTLNDAETEKSLVKCMAFDLERFGWEGPPSQAFIVWGWKR